ncbi:Hexosyltransferase [Fasciolopsis buskii]|uniref:Hexosyltransferase n=1 Tax=Fasciolopsis buskii TaxID=27845 RepID=A0A8E0RRZ3_9TREM|nr:Hexosyltransferase [Fasciolopsis buski]
MRYYRLPSWTYRILLIIIAVVIILELTRQNKESSRVYPLIYEYPLEVNLYEIYEKLGPNVDWTPESNVSVHPINNARFKVIRVPTSFCRLNPKASLTKRNQSKIDILFLVKSRVLAFDQRNAIRNTWGNRNCTLTGGAKTRTIFALGTTPQPQPSVESNLQHEHDRYDDLLQFDFIDSYENNTFKLMSSLTHIYRHCHHARFVMIVDEDFLVNVQNVIRVIKNVTRMEYERFIGGFVYHQMKPMRHPSDKWYLSYDSYPFEIYPPYATGGSIILSRPVVGLLVSGMPFVKFLWIDDVYLGFILMKYGISPKHLSGVFYFRLDSFFELRHAISSHGFSDSRLMHDGWTMLQVAGVCENDLAQWKFID